MAQARDVWQELALRDLAACGRAEAWRTLYDESFESVAAYVRWRASGLPDLADDVLQESWMTAIRKLRTFDPHTCPFAAWVCGIAANVLRHQLRSRTRYRRRVCVLENSEHLVAPGIDETRERAERVARALAELPERYERVLRAKYLDQQSVERIASDGGETAKAVESLLARARQAFREHYERDP